MSKAPKPYFTEEYDLFYLWWPEPRPSALQLAGEFKTEKQMQDRSLLVFGVLAERRNV
jgi:hypothetical protein